MLAAVHMLNFQNFNMFHVPVMAYPINVFAMAYPTNVFVMAYPTNVFVMAYPTIFLCFVSCQSEDVPRRECEHVTQTCTVSLHMRSCKSNVFTFYLFEII